MRRLNVGVTVNFTAEGKVKPLTLIWDDGRKFQIDQIYGMCKAASTKAGGFGIRYTCRIREREFYLFREDDIWFMEVE